MRLLLLWKGSLFVAIEMLSFIKALKLPEQRKNPFSYRRGYFIVLQITNRNLIKKQYKSENTKILKVIIE